MTEHNGRHTLNSDVPLYRIYEFEKDGVERKPLYFSRTGLGRFDLTALGNTEGGTAYWSLEPLGAFIEVFLRRRIVSEAAIERYKIATARFIPDRELLDLTSRKNFGVRRIQDGSWGDDADYSSAQKIAVEAYREGLDGVRYLSPRDPKRKIKSVALFSSTAGPGDSSMVQVIDIEPIPGSLIEQARYEFGIQVEEWPW
jgi:hypothetical protein